MVIKGLPVALYEFFWGVSMCLGAHRLQAVGRRQRAHTPTDLQVQAALVAAEKTAASSRQAQEAQRKEAQAE